MPPIAAVALASGDVILSSFDAAGTGSATVSQQLFGMYGEVQSMDLVQPARCTPVVSVAANVKPKRRMCART